MANPQGDKIMRKYKYPNNVKKGKEHPRWKGGNYEVENGYVFVRVDNHPFKNSGSYVAEHRLVMEKHIGRYLQPEEIVHHINRRKNDNRIENLRLFSNEAEHMRFHMNGEMEIND